MKGNFFLILVVGTLNCMNDQQQNNFEQQQNNFVEYGSGSCSNYGGFENNMPQDQDPLLTIQELQQKLKIQEFTNYFLLNKIETLERFCYGVLSKRLDQSITNMAILLDKQNEQKNEIKNSRNTRKRQ